MTTDTARAILEKLPDDGKFSHRIYHHQTDWDDIDIGSYADLQAMARLWLMRDEIFEFIDATILAAKSNIAMAHRANIDIGAYLSSPDLAKITELTAKITAIAEEE